MTDFKFQQKVQESFRQQGFMEHIGAELVTVKEGFCEIHLPYSAQLTQQNGYFHAGVISTIADNAAGYAAYSMMEPTSAILTVEFKINLLSPGDGEKLIARSKVLKHGKTLTICRSEVYTVKKGKEKLCSAGQWTLIELRNDQE